MARYRTKRTKKGHRSRLEDKIFDQLKKSKLVSNLGYETVKIPYTLCRNYIPDFEVLTRKFSYILIETKGHFPSEDRQKMLAVKEQHPEYDIRIVFARDNFLYKGSKTRYSDWANKHGFEYAIGSVPTSWLKA